MAELRLNHAKSFSRRHCVVSSYVNDGTNDLMDLSVLRSVGTGESS
jgi:hypothetical protein